MSKIAVLFGKDLGLFYFLMKILILSYFSHCLPFRGGPRSNPGANSSWNLPEG